MKWTIIALLVVTVAVAAFAHAKGELGAGLRSAGINSIKFLPILAVAFLLMGLADVLLTDDVIERWLSDASGFRGLATAWLAGVLTPAGSVIGMPLAASLLRAGAGPGVIVTYLTSLATLSVIRVPLEIGFYGWRLMVVRVIASLIVPFIAGLLARWIAPYFLSGA